jgi:tetratricopeptide (TPR) repeat protein
MVDVPDATLNQALEMLERNKETDPDKAPENAAKLIRAYMIRSWKNEQKKLIKEAMEDWGRVVEIDPTHRRAKNNLLAAFVKLGYAYANHGLFDEAAEYWEKAARRDPENTLIVHNLALAYEKAGNDAGAQRFWDETLKRWTQQLEREGENLYLRNCVIEVNRHLNDKGSPSHNHVGATPAPAAHANNNRAPAPAPAGPKTPESELARCQEILRLKPDDFEANYRIGQLLTERKSFKEAAEHLEALQRKYPRNVEIINTLGWAQYNNQELDTAIKTWNRGLKLDKNNFHLRESLIKAHLRMGRALREKNLFIRALVHFKALTKFMPDSEEIHFELGETYRMKGDARSAYLEYQNVLKLNPRHKEARTALSGLKMQRA